jgi:Uma2 family endonuclease
VNPLVDDIDDEHFYEIIDGRCVKLPPTSAYADRIASDVAYRIANFVKANGLGAAIVRALFHLSLPGDPNRRPGAAFVSYNRWGKGRPMDTRRDAWDVVPDLAVEVVSPNDLAEELVDKLDEYFRAGVRQVWILYPGIRLLYVYDSLTSLRILTHSDEVDGGSVLPGFRLAISSLFPEATNS